MRRSTSDHHENDDGTAKGPKKQRRSMKIRNREKRKNEANKREVGGEKGKPQFIEGIKESYGCDGSTSWRSTEDNETRADDRY